MNFIYSLLGTNATKLAHLADDGEHYFGLENFGNTCYCNSVLQALYFCKPFRNCVQNYQPLTPNEETLLTCLSELFKRISAQKKKTGVIAPRKFVTKLRKENELFRGYMHQDAQEFLNYLLNEVSETLIKEKKMLEKGTPAERDNKPVKTWVHDIFEGNLTNETKCLNCEMLTSREESFLDLSVDIEQNSSVSGCLKNFSSSEILCHKDKFFCDNCGSLQEAEKRMKIKKLPNVLALHLKRFKYIDSMYKKLSFRVVFPLELRLLNTSDDAEDSDRLYELLAVVIHIGGGPNQGHYVTVAKSHDKWLIFDDDVVELVDEKTLQSFFGSTYDITPSLESGYILFYQAKDMNLKYDIATKSSGSNTPKSDSSSESSKD